MIVNVRVAFHVSWANRLQLEKISCTSAVLEATNASGSCVGQNVRQRTEEILHLIGYESGFRTETAIIQPELHLVCANDAGNVVRHVDLLLQVVSQLAGEEFEVHRDQVA